MIRAALTELANTLREDGAIDQSECYIDATFASAKGGGDESGLTKRGKGVKIMAIVDRYGLPLAVTTHAANHHEVDAGAADLRLVHDRGATGESDRRSRLRQ